MDRREFDWSLLKTFLTLLEQGSVERAARALRSSPATVTRHVSQLEEQLGCALFERTGRRLMPTRAGESIREHGLAMGLAAEAVARTLDRGAAELVGSVRIGATQGVACSLLPGILGELRQRHPGLRIDLIAGQRASDLLGREADIAIRMFRPEQGALVARKLCVLRFGLFAADSYLQRVGEPQSLGELRGHALIGPLSDDSLLRGLAALGLVVDSDQFALRSDDPLVEWAALRGGLGIGVAPLYRTHGDETVRQVLVDLPLPSFPMWLVVHREVRDSQLIRQCFDALADGLISELGRRHGSTADDG